MFWCRRWLERYGLPSRSKSSGGRQNVLLRLAICRLRGDPKGLGVLQILPEGELRVFLKKVRREDRLARARRDRFVHTVKPIETELGVELRGVVVHGLEVMLVRFFTSERRITGYTELVSSATQYRLAPVWGREWGFFGGVFG